MGHAFGTHVVLRLGRINEIARNVQITCQDDILPHLRQVPDPCLQHGEEAQAEIVSKPIAVGRTVNAEKDEGRKLQNKAATFSVKSEGIHIVQIGNLRKRCVPTNGQGIGKLAVWCR